MNQRVARTVLAVVVLIAASVITHAQSPKPAPSPAGKWTMTVETPHGNMVTAFEIKLEGKKVAAEFESEHSGKVALAGEFADGRVTVKSADGSLGVSAKMKDADSMSVVLSTERGDLAGVATRVKK